VARSKSKKDTRKIRGRLPSKTSINLVLVDEKKLNLGIAIPAVLLIIVLAGAFSKFLVYDRLMEMTRAESEVVGLRSRYDALLTAGEEMTDVEDTYAHYTNAGMTADELGLVDRVKVLELVDSILPQKNTAKNWNVSGNILTIEVTESSLSQQNELAEKIEQSPIVDSCTIMTANKNESTSVSAPSNKNTTQYLRDRNKTSSSNSGKEVWARFVVYLKQPVEEETKAAETDAVESEAAESELTEEEAE